jgi:hypothetical protein
MYEVEITPGLKAWTQDIEYAEQCPCEQFTTTINSTKRSTYGLDSFL